MKEDPIVDLDFLHGDGLKLLRSSLNVTQAQLAKMAEISESTLSKVENSKQNPTLPTLIKLRSALHQALRKSEKYNRRYQVILAAHVFRGEQEEENNIESSLNKKLDEF